jgi:hypothetical protein
MATALPLAFDKIPTGYPKLAAFISKGQDWAIFRKFKELNAMNLLCMQSELMDLESQLQKADTKIAETAGETLKAWWKLSLDPHYRAIIQSIKSTLQEYSKHFSR